MANGHAKRPTQTLAAEARTAGIRRLIEAHSKEWTTIHDEERMKRGLDSSAAATAREQAKTKPARAAKAILDMSPDERAALWALLQAVPAPEPEATP